VNLCYNIREVKEMKKGIIMILFVFCIFLGGCDSNSGKLEAITLEEYKTLIENKESFVLEQWGDDCVHCASLKPKLQKFIKNYGVVVKTINVNQLSSEERKELKQYTGTSSTPVLIFYQNGEEKSVSTRIVGDVSYDKIVEKFKSNGIIK